MATSSMTFPASGSIDGTGGVSVTQHALGGQILGTANGFTYSRVAKADGGYDYYRVAPDGLDVRLIGQPDVEKELGVSLNDSGTAAASTGTGTGSSTYSPYNQAQLDQALQAHQKTIENINKAYNAGLLDFAQKEKAISQNREDLKTSLNTQQNTTGAYFQNVSPDAYQSQIGNYNDKILTEYNRNNDNLTDQEKVQQAAAANLPSTYQGQIANEIASYNANYGRYGAPADNGSTLQVDPNYSGPAENPAASALTPVSMASVGAQLNPYSPNGYTGQKASNPNDQTVTDWLNGK